MSWQLVADAFTDDYKVVLFDYAGSGKSDVSQCTAAKYGRLEGYRRARNSAPLNDSCISSPA